MLIYILPYVALFSFDENRAAVADIGSNNGMVHGTTTGPSIVKRAGRLPYHVLTDDTEGGRPSDETEDRLEVELPDKTDGTSSKTANAAIGQCDDGEGNALNGEEEAGGEEQTSVLAVPNVKRVLFLTCVTQVR